ncbi:hypothetical protein ASC82_00755 [Streptomyces sp. Root431]|uniref:hypothetical protein n=1 Tax=Streptomyces sp. Root431 TaxID=1736535 RepID=UPI0006F7BA1C|nr:hypothetical protein [Streptomyces sp. Root431]KQX17356.1 hypothetical protein ASC82_00755 [Streptomyces sp. Root431]
MTESTPARRAPRPLSELQGVYDLLEEVRLRPGMWIRRSSIQHLDSMLTGYRVALEIHSVDEDSDFAHGGPFSEWLWKRLGMSYPSALGWAAETEREAERRGMPAIQLFFALLDEFLAEQGSAPEATEPAR